MQILRSFIHKTLPKTNKKKKQPIKLKQFHNWQTGSTILGLKTLNDRKQAHKIFNDFVPFYYSSHDHLTWLTNYANPANILPCGQHSKPNRKLWQSLCRIFMNENERGVEWIGGDNAEW